MAPGKGLRSKGKNWIKPQIGKIERKKGLFWIDDMKKKKKRKRLLLFGGLLKSSEKQQL